MIRKLINFSVTALIIGAVTLVATAQGPRNCGATRPNATPANLVSLGGVVGSVSVGLGQGFPSFTLAQADGRSITVIAGPYDILLENNFAINIGDRMSVRAFESLRVGNTFVAVELNNLTTGATLTLRDENGLPLWSPGPGRRRCF